MERKEMLDRLHSIEGVMIGDMVMTYDIGMQFAYATKKGYGYDDGYHVGRWPVIHIQDNSLREKWEKILEKINEGTLCYDDLKETDLETIANRVNKGYSLLPGKDPETNKVKMSEYLKPLYTISKEGSNDFFIFMDLGTWELDNFRVYATKEEAEKEFIDQYCYINEWEELDDEELEEWCEKLFSEYSEFTTLGDDSDEEDEVLNIAKKRTSSYR